MATLPLNPLDIVNAVTGIVTAATGGGTASPSASGAGTVPATPAAVPASELSGDDARTVIAMWFGSLTDEQVTAAIGHYQANHKAMDAESWNSFIGKWDAKAVIAMLLGAMDEKQVQLAVGNYRANRKSLDSPEWETFLNVATPAPAPVS